MLSVWEDLTVCDFLDIIDSWKLVGWGKNGVQGTNLLDRIISVLGCLKPVQNSYFRSRPAIFQFSWALIYIYIYMSHIWKCTWAPSEGLVQPAHLYSAYSLLGTIWTDNHPNLVQVTAKTDQTVPMCRLIWVCADYSCQKVLFAQCCLSSAYHN